MANRQVLRDHQANRDSLIRLLLAELGPLFTGSYGPRVLDAVVGLVRQYAAAAAELGARFYEDLRLDAGAPGVFTPTVAELPAPEQIAASLQWATNTGEDPAAARTKAEGAAQRLALQPERDTITTNSHHDEAARGFARVSTTGSPCGFCAVLISRGPVYTSRVKAGPNRRGRRNPNAGKAFEGAGQAKMHDNDECAVVAVFGDDWPGADQYDHYEQLYRDVTAGYSGQDAINAMRRHLERGT